MNKTYLTSLLVAAIVLAACGQAPTTSIPATLTASPTDSSATAPVASATPASVSSTAAPADFATVTYAASDQALANPFRGFYYHTETYSGDYTPLTLEELQTYGAQDHITLILRVFYLEDFVGDPISEEYLANIRQDLAVVREAGFSAVVRFAYTSQGTLPYGDAPKDIVLGHIAQVAPILQEYSDVVKVVQAGFIGSWGEWYFTDYFVQDPAAPDVVTEADYQNRREVVAALLQALPTETFVLLRTPNFKRQFFPGETLNASNAYNGSDVARVGFHNDCFLASADDYGTYADEADREFLAAETAFSPMGGETCNPDPPRSSCANALQELAQFHWSFINIGYHPAVPEGWREEGCFSDIERKLGYRFSLVSASFSPQVAQGQNFQLELALKNLGWAGPFVKMDVELVLRNQADQQEYSFVTAADPRAWLPADDTYTFVETLCIPQTVPAGAYDLFLRLSPPDAKNKALYAIQFANEINWEPTTGLNDLGITFEVQPATAPAECQGQ